LENPRVKESKGLEEIPSKSVERKPINIFNKINWDDHDDLITHMEFVVNKNSAVMMRNTYS